MDLTILEKRAPANNTVLEALFAGFVLSTVLYGLTVFQTYLYFSRYSKDDIWNRVFVGVLWVLDSVLTGLVSQSMYFYLVTLFSKTNQAIVFTKTLSTEHVLTALCVLSVQLFYIDRIWGLSNKAKLAMLSMALPSFAAFGCAIAYVVRIFENRALETFSTKQVRVLFGASSGLNTLCDIMITASLFYWLSESRQENGPHTTQLSLFDKIIVNYVNRGPFLGFVQLALFVTFVTTSASAELGWIPLQLILSKVYINSLLGLLNYRPALHGRGVREEEVSALSTDMTQDTLDDFTGVHVSLEQSTKTMESPLKEASDAFRAFKNELVNS